MTIRVATQEQLAWAIRRFGQHQAGAELRRRGLMPPIAGGAGWATNVAGNSTSATVAGTTGVSLAFASNVTAGDVIAAGGTYSLTSAQTPTFSDTSGNVTTWHTAGNFAFPSGVSFNIALSWGIATTTGACTPKLTWGSSSSAFVGLFIGDFTPPAGTISQDGTLALQNQTTSTTTITLPAGPGTGTNDLLINYIGCQGSFTSFSAPWTAMGPSYGDGCGYTMNAAGNTTANATQSNANYGSIMLALQATGGGGGGTALTAYMTSTNSTIL